VGDAEREDAVRALGEHMSAGRLDLEEYGERTARVATTKTRGDLLDLFSDLPEPRPRFADPVPDAQWPAERTGPSENRPVLQRLYPALMPISVIVAAVLYFSVARGVFLVFLLPIAVAVLGGSMVGDRSRQEQRRAVRHERRYRGPGRWSDRRGDDRA